MAIDELLLSATCEDNDLDIALESEIGRRSLYEFVKMAWDLVVPAPFVDNWHIGAICEHLQAVTEGEISNLVVNIPPGMSKSLLCSCFWMPWEWARDPSIGWLFFSHDISLSSRDSRVCRDLIGSSWYKARWSARIKRDQNQKLEYESTAGGFRKSTTTCGKVTGSHPNRIVGDDANNAIGAENKKKRDACNQWWDQEVSTRGAGVGVRRVIIQQRFHQKDLTGHVLAEDEGVGEYVHLMIPMRFEEGRKCTTVLGFTDPRTKEGELLDPARYPEPVVIGLERKLGVYGAAGQLQQRPNARVGAMFKTDRLQFVPAAEFNPKRMKRVIRAWDKAGTKDAGCYTAGALLALDLDDNPWIIDMVRERWSTEEVENQLDLWSRLDEQRFKRDKAQTVFEREPGASGLQAAKETLRRLRGRRCRAVLPQGNKIVRAEIFANPVNLYEVRIVEGPWNSALIEEMQAVPNGEYMDQVDACSLGFSELMNAPTWMPPGEDEDGVEAIGRQACKHPECDRLVDPTDGEYCCPSCRLAHARKQGVDNATHSPVCNERHGQLYARGKWEPASRVRRS